VSIPHNRARPIAFACQVAIVNFYEPYAILFSRAANALPGGFGIAAGRVDILARDISFNVVRGAAAGEPRGAI
jgi:hypothetical protein